MLADALPSLAVPFGRVEPVLPRFCALAFASFSAAFSLPYSSKLLL